MVRVIGRGRSPHRLAGPPRRARLLAAVLGCVLAAACTGPGGQAPAPTTQAAAPVEREYWPTDGWRTAAPDQQGMDPAVLDHLETIVPASYPRVRSVLVVRHGYLVYERYWQGLDAGDGHNSYSVTKSFVSALVGIALRERRLRSLDQTVGELLADHLPATADPRLRQVTVKQLLTMTSGLAGDDALVGGADSISDRMAQSRDWIRHILGRRLVTAPGESWAYSSASSHLLSAIVADATGQSTMAFARAELFGPSASVPTMPWSRRSATGRRPRPSWRPTSRRRWPGPETRRATTTAAGS